METIESCRYDTCGHTPRELESARPDLSYPRARIALGADRSVRGDQLIRQWRIVSLLSGRVGRSLDQLKAELGVTKRTIQRDIAVLEAAGFPVISESREGTVYWRLLDPTKESAELSFTLPELMALYFSRDLLKVLHGSPMQDALDSALQKIGARLPASGHDLLRRLKEQTAVSVTGWKDYSKSSKVIDALNRAIRTVSQFASPTSR